MRMVRNPHARRLLRVSDEIPLLLLLYGATIFAHSARVTVQPHAGGPVRTVTVAYTAPFGSSLGIGGLGSPTDPRPEKIAQVRPGIFYVNLELVQHPDRHPARPSGLTL